MTRRTNLPAVFLAILLAVSAALPGVGADDQSGVCERALSDCLNDPASQATAPFGTVVCIVGYAFCKKYIDPGSAC